MFARFIVWCFLGSVISADTELSTLQAEVEQLKSIAHQQQNTIYQLQHHLEEIISKGVDDEDNFQSKFK